MKHAFFFLFLVVLLSENCKKEDSKQVTPTIEFDTAAYRKKIKTDQMEGVFLPGETLNGQATAQKNGKDWIASSAVASDVDHFYIETSTVNPEGTRGEHFFFMKVPKKTGLYRFDRNTVDADEHVAPVYSLVEGGDATLINLYHNMDYVDTDFLELTMVDTTNHIIAGRFDVHLTDSLLAPYPVYLHMANGTFETKY